VGGLDCFTPSKLEINNPYNINYANNKRYINTWKGNKQQKVTHRTINLCHLNCRGLANEPRLQELEHALTKINYDILGLSEVRKMGEGLIKRSNGNYFYYYGTTKGYRGVGFYIKKEIMERVTKVKAISERICMLKIKVDEKIQLSVFQIYAPTLVAEEKEHTEFYNLLQETLEREKEYYNVVMGDWNAKVGRSNWQSQIMGPFGSGSKNENGEKLIKFATTNNLKITGSYFKKKMSRRWTWISPDKYTKNEIDHFLINDMRIVKDGAVLNTVSFSSDHRLCRTSLHVPYRVKYKNYRKVGNGAYTNNHIIPQDKITEANLFMKDQLNKTKWNENIGLQNKYNDMVKAIELTVTKFGKKVNPHITNNKITDKTKELINKRDLLRNKLNKTSREKIELCEINKTVKKAIRQDVKEYDENQVIQTLQETTSVRKANKKLQQNRKLMVSIHNEEGNEIHNRDKIVTTVTDYYTKLYKRVETDIELKGTQPPPRESYTSPIVVSEIVSILNKLKPNKCPGPDQIKNEWLKACAEPIAKVIVSIFNEILTENVIPEQWCESEIILLFKKGDKKKMENYRPITLNSNICKVFMKVIKNRIYGQLDSFQPKEQAGFRKNFSTLDHIITINQVLEKTSEFKIETHLLFIDFRKVFDTVSHKFLWEALRAQGVEAQIISILEKIYGNSKAYVRLDKCGPPFPIERGVKQGDPLSPNLFNCILQEVFKNLDWEGKGIKIHGNHLTNLRFADDIVLLSNSTEELQKMGEELLSECKKAGL